jgi:hypothetical protein
MDRSIDLVRDLLDVQLMDRNQRRIGRVDGVLLELRDNQPPRVVAMDVGPITLVRRVSPTLSRWLRALAIRWLPVSLRSVQLPLTLFRDVGVDIELDVDAQADRRLLRVEKWLTRHIVGHLPGAARKQGREEKQ